MAQAYAQFRGVMTVELGTGSQQAFAQFTNQAERAGSAGANSMNRFTRSVDGLEGKLRTAGAGVATFSGYGGRLASQLNAAANAIALTGARTGGLIAALAGGASLLGATTDIQNYVARLKAATQSQGEFNSAYAQLLGVSKATRSDLGETIGFYTRLKANTRELGLSQQQLAQTITTVQQAVKLSGAGTQEAAAAMTQFAQAIGSASGLSGDEFKSLGENATVVLQSIADGLRKTGAIKGFDGTIGALRELGAQGKLTADVLIPALAAVSSQVDANFSKLPPTIGQATTAIRTSFLNLVLQAENATGVLAGTAGVMIGVANNLDLVGVAAATLGGLLAARLVPALLATRLGLVAVAAVSIAGPIGALTSGFAALAAGGAGFQAVAARLVTFLGGPWAIGLGVAAGALTFLATRKNEAEKAAADMGVAEDQLGIKVRSLTGYILNQNAALERNTGLLSERQKREAQEKIGAADSDQAAARNRLANALTTNQAQFPVAGRSGVSDLAQRIRKGLAPQEVQAALNDLEKLYPKTFRIIGGEIDKAADGFALASGRLKSNQLEFQQAQADALTSAFPLRGKTGLADVLIKDADRAAAGIAAKAGTIEAARATFAKSIAALNKEFGLKGKPGETLSADRAEEFAQRKAQIIEARDAEIAGIKAAQAARRAGLAQVRKEERDFMKDRQAEAETMQGILDRATEAEGRRLESLKQLRLEDANRIAGLQLEAQGMSATAAALNLMIQRREVYGGLTRENARDAANQVEAEAAINQQLQRRNALLQNDARALGQIQGAFTTLFSGDAKGFVRGLGDAFKQQFAQRLSIGIFGDVENEAQLENTGALKVNTDALGRLVDALNAAISQAASQQAAPQLAPTVGIAANDNRPGSPTAEFVKASRVFGDVGRLFKDQQTKDFLQSNRLGAFGARAGGTFGLKIGDTLDQIFGSGQRDSNGVRLPGTGSLARSLGSAGTAIGAGIEGYQAGEVVTSLFDSIGIFDKNSKSAKTGSAIGSTVGAIGGSFFGPAGTAIGAAIGNIIGTTIGAAFKKNPFGDVRLTAGQSGSVFNSRGADSGAQALTIADSVNQGLSRLGQALGVGVRSGTSLGSIGFSGEQFYFNSTGGDFKGAGNQRFGTAEEAVTAAIRNAVQVGAFDGLREGSKRLLLAGADLQAQAQKAADFQNVFTELRRATDPAGAALDDLNSKFTRLREIFVEAGASTEEYGKLQQLYDLQRAEALSRANDTLKDFLTELTTSQSSGLSVRERQANAQAAFAGFQADIGAGRTVDQGKFRDAAQTLLDVNRELFGSQGGYFDSLTQITDLTRRAITNTGAGQTLPEALQLANAPVTDGLAAVRNAVDDGIDRMIAAMNRLMGNGGAANDWAGYGGGNRYAVGGVRDENF